MAATAESTEMDETPVQLDPSVDINQIDDEDLLRKLWQTTEDFADKRRIRARMYKLREKRLKDFYTSDDVVGDAPTSRSESPFMMLEAHTAPEGCQVSSMSSSVTSYSYSTSAGSGPAEVSTTVEMEVDESTTGSDGTIRSSVRRESRRQTTEQNKRRSNDEEDVVSEKIRRKSSERTKRYQQIMSEITSAAPEVADEQLAAAAEADPVRTAEDLNFSSDVTMESSQTAEKNADEDSEAATCLQKVNNKTLTTRMSTVETTTTRSERRSPGGQKVVEESTSQRTSSSEGAKGSLTTSTPGSGSVLIERSVESSRERGTESPRFQSGQLASFVGDLVDGVFSQELKKSSSRREIREGDIITTIEVTETWRRVREGDQSEPITQRVTVTKTTRKRADGTLLEENEDEVIDDLDSAAGEGQMITAVDALLSSVTSARTLAPAEPEEVHEETIVSKKAFLCGDAADSSAGQATVDVSSLEESIARDVEEYRRSQVDEQVTNSSAVETDSLEDIPQASEAETSHTTLTTEIVSSTEIDLKDSQLRRTPDASDHNEASSFSSELNAPDEDAAPAFEPIEIELEVTEGSAPVVHKMTREETKLKIKRTPSDSPSRITKRRPDGTVVTKEVEIGPGKKTTTTTTSSSSSRNVGGVKQINNSTTVSRVTTSVRSPVKENSKSLTTSIPKLQNSSSTTTTTTTTRKRAERSESSELKASPPSRKTSNGTSDLMDESVDEFVKLEQEMEKESTVQEDAEEKYARDILSRPSVLQLDLKAGAETQLKGYRSLKESSALDRSPSPSSIKRLGLKSSNIPSAASSPTSTKKSGSVTESLKSSSSVKSQSNRPQSPLVTEQRKVTSVETRVSKKSPTSTITTTTTSSSIPRISRDSTTRTTTRQTESKTTKMNDIKPGTMVRTVEVTRTVAVRDDDKPWRANTKREVSKTVYGGKKNLHGNVMNVVEKYVDSDGCAIHGSHKHPDVKSREESSRSRTTRTTVTTTKTSTRGQEEEEEEEEEDEEVADEEEEERPESLSPPPLIDPKNLDDQPADQSEADEDVVPERQQVDEDAEEFPEPPTAEEIGVDSGLVQPANGDDAELVEVEELVDAKYREPLSAARASSTATASVFERIQDESSESTETRQRPSLLFTKDRPSSPSKEKLVAASPVLGSPSVVMKARSLFDSEKTEEVPATERKVTTDTSTRQSISKIRSAFESPRGASSPSSASESIRTEVRTVTSTLRRSSSKEDKSVGKLKTSLDKPAEESTPEAKEPEAEPVPEVTPTPAPEPANDVEMDAPAETAKSESQVIEDIEDLTLLENMLNTATSYDDRSRIRAQIRIVRKKFGLTGTMPSSASSSPMVQRRQITSTVQTTGTTGTGGDSTRLSRTFVTTTRRTEETDKRSVKDTSDVDSVAKEPESAAAAVAQKTCITRVESVVESAAPIEVEVDNSSRRSSSARIISRKSTEITTITKRSSQTSLKTSTTEEEVVRSAPAITSSEEPKALEDASREETSESVTTHRTEVTRKGPEDEIKQLEEASPVKNNPWRKMIEKSESSSSVEDKDGKITRTLTSKKSQSELKIWARLPEPDQPAATLDITSSYGTGPMDEYGKPLFGLGALRRKKPAVTEDSGSTQPTQPPQPIIIERSQTLNELQKLHEHQQVQQKETESSTSAEKPRAKLRDTFTSSRSEESDETDSSASEREPIIGERSQALKDIIRKHEHVTTEVTTVTEHPQSPKPKAKLKDSFVSSEFSTSISQDDNREPVVERSEAFQTIVKRHQELSQVTQSSTSTVPATPASPVKRPGILKKPKDWSPSPQELPSPAKEDSRKSAEETTTTTMTTTATTTTLPRKQSIEIQLNPVDNHLVVVQEVPDAEVVRRSSVITTYTTSSINTIQLRSQEEEDALKKSTPAGRIADREETTTSSRKTSIEIEPVHKATATFTTGTTSEATVSSPRQPLKVEEPEIVPSAARASGRFSRASRTTEESGGNLVSRLSSRFSRTSDNDSKSTDSESKTSRLVSRFSTRGRDTDSSVSKTTETSTKVSEETEKVPTSVGSRLSSRFASRDADDGTVTETTTTKTVETTSKTSASSKMEDDDSVPITSRLSRFGSRNRDTETSATKTTESVTKSVEKSKAEDDESTSTSSRLSSRFSSRTREVDSSAPSVASTTTTTETTTKTVERSKMEDEEPVTITSRLSSSRFARARDADSSASSAATSTATTTETTTLKTVGRSKVESDEPYTITSRLSSSRFARTRDAGSNASATAASTATSTVTSNATSTATSTAAPAAESTAESAVASTATATTTKTVETVSKMDEDEYIPVTSRLSSRFGSRGRDADSVVSKSTVTTTKTEETEYVPVSSRLSSRFSSRTRQDVDATQTAKTEVEETQSPRAPFKLTGESSGHTTHSTSTFQLQTSTSRESSVPRDESTERPDSAADSRSAKTRQELQEFSAATRAEVTLLTRQTSESGDGLIKEKSRKFSGEPTQRAPPEPKTTGKLPASRYVLQRQESLKLESRIKTMPAGASVRALAQRFQSSAEGETPQRKTSSGSYPKAGLIFRSSSFRQSCSPDREVVRTNSSMVQRSESLRTSSPRIRNRTSMERQSQEREDAVSTSVQSETTEVTGDALTPRDSELSTPRSVSTTTERRTSSFQTTTIKSSDSPVDVNRSSTVSVEFSPSQSSNKTITTTTTTTKSFLEDRTPVRGMQDIIGRMKAAPETNGTTSEDDRALSLLNKFLGAQILVQCTEPLVNSQTPEVVETVTTSQHLSEDGKSLTRSTTANRSGSQHQVTSGSDEQGRSWKQESSSAVTETKTLTTTNTLDENLPGSMAQPCIVDGVDINTCQDDFKLNELLDNCNDYETRCKLRARIKFLLSNAKADGIDDPTVTEMAAGADESDHNNVVTASSSSSSSSTATSASSSSSTSSASSSSSTSSSSRKKLVQRSQSASSASSSTTSSASSASSSAPSNVPSPGPSSPAVLVSLPLSSLVASSSQRCSVDAPTDRVIAWVSKGLDPLAGAEVCESLAESSSDFYPAADPAASGEDEADTSVPLVMVMEDSALHAKSSSSDKDGNSAGELFDSGTESGEDTTKSNHSEPDLTSFMENLKLSLDMNQASAKTAHSASSVTSKQSNEPTSDSRMSINSSGGDDFLSQVDVVLSRLKTSLQADTASSISPAPSDDRQIFPSDSQEVLHEYIASGGLSLQQPWEVGTLQRSELIGLIDRLQSSLHDLQRRSTTTTPSPSPQPPQPVPVPTVDAHPAESTRDSTQPKEEAKHSVKPAASPTPPSTDDAPLIKNKNLSWRADFLKPTAKPATSRPIWCRRDSETPAPPGSTNSGKASLSPASRVLLETPGVRGRFFHQPGLQPAPKVSPKPTPRTVIPPPKLPSFILAKESRSPENKATVTCGSLTVQVNRNEEQGLVLKVGQPNSSGMNGSVSAAVSKQPQTGTTANNSVDSEPKSSQEVGRSQASDSGPVGSPAKSSTSAEETSVTASPSPPTPKTERKGRADIPWKVKLAKKKAERSQTSQLEGSLSVDLRKSIQLAAHRKSVEDLFSINATSTDAVQVDEPVKAVTAHPILKQKSMSDLYHSRPKPFERSGSVGGFQRSLSQVKAVELKAPEKSTKTESKTEVEDDEASEDDDDENVVPLAECPIVQSVDQLESNAVSTSTRSTAAKVDEVTNIKSSAVPFTGQGLNGAPAVTKSITRAPLRRQTAVENARVGSAVATGETSAAPAAVKTTSVNIESSVRVNSDDQLVTTGILRMSSGGDAQLPLKTSVPRKESQDSAGPSTPTASVPGRRRFSSSISFETSPVTTPTTETAVSKVSPPVTNGPLADPSQKLFTASESIQIAIHKAAINKQISEEEARRRGEPPTPDALEKLTTPLSKFEVQFQKALPSADQTAAETPVAEVSGKLVVDTQRSRAAVTTAATPSPAPVVASESKALSQKKELFKEKARRSNTIAIPQPTTAQVSSEFEANQTSKPLFWKPSTTYSPVDFEPKTENDKKFQNFLNKTANKTGQVQSVKLAFLPAANQQSTSQVGMWTNKFSNIRSAFESKTENEGNRSRRSSGEPVTTGSLKVEFASAPAAKATPVTHAQSKVQLFSSKDIAAACASAAAAAASRTQANTKPAKPSISLVKPEPPPRQQVPYKPVAATATNVSAMKNKPQSSHAAQVNGAGAADVQRQPSNDSESAMHVVLNSSQGRLTVKSGPALMSSSSVGGGANVSTAAAALSNANVAKSATISPVKTVPMEAKQNQVANATAGAAAGAVRSDPVKSINSHGGYQLPAITRLRNERSCSSVRTFDSTRSGSKDDDDDKDGEYGDDEASSTSSSSSSSSSPSSSDVSSDEEEDDGPPATPPKQSGIQSLSNIVQKFASMDDVTTFLQRDSIPVVPPEPLEVKLSLAPPLPPRLNVIKPIAPAPVTTVNVPAPLQPEKKLEPPAPPVRFSSPSVLNKWVPPAQQEPPAKAIPAGLKTGIVKSFSTHIFNKNEPPKLLVPANSQPNSSYGITRTKSAASSFGMASQSLQQPHPGPVSQPKPFTVPQVVPEKRNEPVWATGSHMIRKEKTTGDVKSANGFGHSPNTKPFTAMQTSEKRSQSTGSDSHTTRKEAVTSSDLQSNGSGSYAARKEAVTSSSLQPNGIGSHVARKEAMTLSGLQPANGSSLSPASTAVRSRSLSAQRTYLEPAGPTLVGLKASNVSTGSSRSVNSVVSSAQNFVPTLEVPATSQDYSPASSIMKSVSSSRLVSGAKEQLSKKDCPLVASRPRPQSLILPASRENGIDHHPSPDRRSSSVVRTATTIGTKQFEAFLSPDSAEKKQREIMQFFAMASANQSSGSPSNPKATSSAMKSVQQSESSAVKMRFKARTSTASSSAQRPRAVSEGAVLGDDIHLDDLISDVDEVFEKILGDTDTLKRAAKSRPAARELLEMDDVAESPASQSSDDVVKSKFADRRRAWEESSACKLHINQAAVYNLQASCPADGIKTGRNFGSTVVTQNQVVTRQTTTRTGGSAFAKFQQLDKSARASPSSSALNSAHNKNVRNGGGIQSASFGVKDVLLQWCQFHTRAYKNVRIENFSTSWNDGMAFCALIHHFYPDAFDFDKLEPCNKSYNFDLAFKTAEEKAGIAPLLDVEDMVLMDRPDWKCVFTYVQSFYRRFELQNKEPTILL